MSNKTPMLNVDEAMGPARSRTDGRMRFGVLGTGEVGRLLGTKLVSLGDEVFMGSRDPANPKAAAWAAKEGPRARHGTFRDAAAFGDIVINATTGSASLAALESAGADNLNGRC